MPRPSPDQPSPALAYAHSLIAWHFFVSVSRGTEWQPPPGAVPLACACCKGWVEDEAVVVVVGVVVRGKGVGGARVGDSAVAFY